MRTLKTTESKISFLLGSLVGICISFSYFSTRGPSEGWGYWIFLVATFAFWFFVGWIFRKFEDVLSNPKPQ